MGKHRHNENHTPHNRKAQIENHEQTKKDEHLQNTSTNLHNKKQQGCITKKQGAAATTKNKVVRQKKTRPDKNMVVRQKNKGRQNNTRAKRS